MPRPRRPCASPPAAKPGDPGGPAPGERAVGGFRAIIPAPAQRETSDAHQAHRPQLQTLRQGRGRAGKPRRVHRPEQFGEDLGHAGPGPVGHRRQTVEREARGQERAGKAPRRDGQPQGPVRHPPSERRPPVARPARPGRPARRRPRADEQRADRPRRRGGRRGQALDARPRLRQRRVALLPPLRLDESAERADRRRPAEVLRNLCFRVLHETPGRWAFLAAYRRRLRRTP